MVRTRKIVKLEVTCTFEGDYFDASECPGMAEHWIDGAFDDRDDLRGWRVEHLMTLEEPLGEEDDA